MKLKVTWRTSAGDRDIVLTTDGASTAGDVARFLGSDGMTLRVTPPGAGQPVVLNPLSSVHDSELRSGCVVEVTTPPHAAAGMPVAYLDVTAGPDVGRRLGLPYGTSYVGRAAAADVQLHDPSVSRRHATVAVTDPEVAVRDLNSGNGVFVDGVKVDRGVITDGSTLQIGETTMTLHVPPRVTAPPGQVNQARAEFNRSPRVEEVFTGETLVAPQLPSPPDPPGFPMLAVLAPVVLGAVLFAVTRQPITLLFIALSPVIMLGTWIDNRWQTRRRRRDEAARFDADLDALRHELTESAATEQAARVAESPSVQQVMTAVFQHDSLLWTRKPEHAAFLRVRFGLGILPSRTAVTLPSRPHAALDEWSRLNSLVDEFRTIAGVPVVESLDTAGAIGIAGAGEFADAVARSLLVQLTGLHSPADLVITAIASPQAAAGWEWLKWLPHIGSAHSPIRGGLAADVQTASALLAELETLIDTRRAAGIGRGERVRSRLSEEAAAGKPDDAVEREPATPAVVLFVLGEPPTDRSRIVAVGAEGADYGVHVIWIAPTVTQLPVICRTHVEIAPDWTATVGFVRTGRTVALQMLDASGPNEAAQIARWMAPLSDTGSPLLDETDLPSRVAFLDLIDDQIADDPAAVIRRWRSHDTLKGAWTAGNRRPAGTLRAVVGQGPVEPFHLDLRRNGPHALVGGTTGSGKSEFLQSWILGMATEYSPEQVTFLLVDYKGGAAFAECVRLPHTVGLVTDLSPHLVTRALTSLRAELRYREHLLNVKGAKDLETLEQRSDPDAPPALVIVIDEFAALVTEVPEFIDGVIDIAQRGRSLGLHLVMATQRPAGVIRDNLRANTNLRVALRVADEADSLDVIGTPAAAHFDPDTPGRAAAKLGTGRLHDFQTAYLGGWTLPGRDRTAEITAADLTFGNPAPWPTPVGHTVADDSTPRDIARLVDSIRTASTNLALPPARRPWIAELPAIIDLDTLHATTPNAIGLIDVPEQQEQNPLTFDLEQDGHLLLIGASGSGKTTALRTLTATHSANADTDPIQIYALDFAGGALTPLGELPTVSAVITDGDHERVARVLRRLGDLATERSTLFAAAGAGTLTEYRRLTGLDAPRIVLLLDGMTAFRTQYEFADRGRHFDALTRLAGLGRQLGIHLVVTADRTNAMPSSLLTSFSARIVLRLAAASDYSIAGVDDQALDGAPAGRGLFDGHEIQFATPGGTAEPAQQAEALRALATRLHDNGITPAPPVERLPEHVPLHTLPLTVEDRPVLGIDDDTLSPIGLRTDGLFVVTGPFRSGRTTTLHTITRSVQAAHPELAGYHLSTQRTRLGTLIDWAGTTSDAETAEQLATELATRLEQPAHERDTHLFIVIEHSTEFEGLVAEATIARLLKAARRAEVPIIVETDTVTGSQSWQIYNELKTARAGIILQPEEADGNLFRVQLPRVTRTDFPPGRGFLIDAGRIRKVQVAS